MKEKGPWIVFREEDRFLCEDAFMSRSLFGILGYRMCAARLSAPFIVDLGMCVVMFKTVISLETEYQIFKGWLTIPELCDTYC